MSSGFHQQKTSTVVGSGGGGGGGGGVGGEVELILFRVVIINWQTYSSLVYVSTVPHTSYKKISP